MFKFLRKRTRFVIIRAEELLVGDTFFYDNDTVEVKATALTPKYMIVDLHPTHPSTAVWDRTVSLHRELKIIVPR